MELCRFINYTKMMLSLCNCTLLRLSSQSIIALCLQASSSTKTTACLPWGPDAFKNIYS
ncbi:unnamed protein product [Moneuplotes crassus]|uniref:Uncharacterized protein n=1 Tax=Euplotes crassus TaxID=5936 RepID=A0AAD1XDR0_EUPCR|nr:unnamed protein product [Moneuplotes crassus]